MLIYEFGRMIIIECLIWKMIFVWLFDNMIICEFLDEDMYILEIFYVFFYLYQYVVFIINKRKIVIFVYYKNGFSGVSLYV